MTILDRIVLMGCKPQNKILERIYEYEDYRDFLRDFFKEQKRLRATFSYRWFAQKAGLSSPSLCIDVMKGRVNLTLKTLPKITKGLGLRGRTASFFRNLVLFNQARDEKSRDEHLCELVRIRKGSQLYRLKHSQFAYFDNWYYPVLRELVVHSDWQNDYSALAQTVYPPITESQAREAVDALVSLGLVRRGSDGTWEQSRQGLSTKGVPYPIQKQTRRNLMKLGLAAGDLLGPDDRYIAHATVSMSEKSYQEAVRIYDEARKRIVDLALNDPDVDKVYEAMLLMFPLSAKTLGSRRSESQ